MNRLPGARDLVGYGGSAPTPLWPNGARVAVSIVVNFEEGAESSIEAGDAAGESIGEIQTIIRPGVRDLGQEQLFAYGMRAGVWRILDALRRHAIPSTFLMCGYAVERAPAVARTVVDQGHEAACHGWRWRPHSDFVDRASEHASLAKCIDVIDAATGTRPVGFFCRGSQSAFTRDLLIDLGFEYDSNALDDDLPYWAETPSGRHILAVPYALDSNDVKFYHPNGFARPEELVSYVKGAIDALLEEGSRGRTNMLSVGYHLRISGRPGRIASLVGVLEYLKSLGDAVWVARRCDIAEFWRTQFPKPGDRE